MTHALLNHPVINTTQLHTRTGNIVPIGTLGTVRGVLRGGQLLQVEFQGRGFVQVTPDRVLPVHLPAELAAEALGDDLVALVEALDARVQELEDELAAERERNTRLQRGLDAAVKFAARAPRLAPPRADFSWRQQKRDDRPRKNGNGRQIE